MKNVVCLLNGLKVIYTVSTFLVKASLPKHIVRHIAVISSFPRAVYSLLKQILSHIAVILSFPKGSSQSEKADFQWHFYGNFQSAEEGSQSYFCDNLSPKEVISSFLGLSRVPLHKRK